MSTQTMARSTNEKLRMFRALGQVLLDTTSDDAAVRAVSFTQVPEAALRIGVFQGVTLGIEVVHRLLPAHAADGAN